MADPFAEPIVGLSLMYKSGASQGTFNIERLEAVQFMKAFNEKDPTAESNIGLIRHKMGVVSVELNNVASIAINSGSQDKVRDLFDLF